MKYTITIDYSRTLADMIKAGTYGWTNDNITAERFPVKGTGIVERTLTLYHPNRSISSSDVEKALGAVGKEPAPIEDLLAFGEKYPELQREYPIIALGSAARVYGRRAVPCLGGVGSGRFLGLSWYDSEWFDACRFLARNKPSDPDVEKLLKEAQERVPPTTK